MKRGLVFTQAYATCPVCVPSRYTIRTGCQPPTTRTFSNAHSMPAAGQVASMTGRCGPYLAETMRDLGYRTFGIGKFHTQPWDEKLGYDVHLRSEELYGTSEQCRRDDFAAWIAREHPAYDFIEGLMGERTEMYYMPQMSPMPAACTVERWAADRAIEQIRSDDGAAVFRLCLVHRTAPAVCPADPVQPDVRPGPHAESDLRRPPRRSSRRADSLDELRDLGGGHQQFQPAC